MAQPLVTLCLLMLVQNLHLQGVASQAFGTYAPTSWKKIFSYNNIYSYPVTQTSQWTKGLKTRTNRRSIAATQEFGSINVGDQFEFTSLGFSYIDNGDKREESMDADEIYQPITRQSRVTIPARTLLTKWQLVVNFAGHEVGYDHTVETHGNTIPHIHVGDDDNDDDDNDNPEHNPSHDHDRSRARNRGHHHKDVSRVGIVFSSPHQIHYGTTKIRIRNTYLNQYLAVARPHSRRGMPLATLSSSSSYQFILYKSGSRIKIRTLNPVYRGYEYLTSDARGQAHFTRNSGSVTQQWDVTKRNLMSVTPHLLDRDNVTLRNYGTGGGFLREDNGQLKTQPFLDRDIWTLEAV